MSNVSTGDARFVKIEVNNVKSRILFDPAVYNDEFQACMYAADNKLSFLLPNAIQNQNYNTILSDGSRKWDGKKHLLNPYLHTKYSLQPFEFFTGKIRLVLEILLRHGYKPQLDDKRIRPVLNENVWQWNPKYALRDYQEEVVARAVKVGRGLCKMATGAGKTQVGAGIIHRLGVSPTIFLVTTKDLMYQAQKRFEDSLLMPIGIVGDGHCEIKDVNVCTIQTCAMAFGKEEEFIEQCKAFKTVSEDELDLKEEKVSSDKYENIRNLVRGAKLVIFDEAHHVASDSCSMILELCESAFFRFALGATIQRDDGLDPIIEALFGDYISDVSASFLIKKGYLIPPHIYLIPVSKYLGECETYASEYKQYIAENEFRNEIIVKLAGEAIKAKMPTLILVKHIKHGDVLQKAIPGSVFIQGSVSGKKRTELIQKVRDRELCCIIATSLADEGLDIICLECLILGGSGKSIVKAMQRVGRVLRPDYDNPKKRAIVYDFIDLPRILHHHSLSRKKIYLTEPEFHIYDFRYKKHMSEAAKNTKDLFEESD